LRADRPLTFRENAAIYRILNGATFDGAAELRAQIPETQVAGSSNTTWLDLRVSESAPRSRFREGHIPVRAVVPDVGEFLLWVEDGCLSALEYAWYTDDEPTEFPSADVIQVEAET
jgi:hypothetical protein